MDEAGSHVHISHLKLPKELLDIEEQLAAILLEKRTAVDKKDYKKAAALRIKERHWKSSWLQSATVGTKSRRSIRKRWEKKRLPRWSL